ncbi:hypothetical protein HK104_000731 [Borealophlyctis nickersoniae]|nr:hypothetical protein HK104_000731 [Borealophlyctis nickersoniae]
MSSPRVAIVCLVLAACALTFFTLRPDRLPMPGLQRSIDRLESQIAIIEGTLGRVQHQIPWESTQVSLSDSTNLHSYISEDTLVGPTRRFTMHRVGPSPTTAIPHILILTIINDHRSWGSNNRNFSHYLKMISNFTHPATSTSLGFLVSSPQEYERMKLHLLDTLPNSQHPYTRVTLLHRSTNTLPTNIKTSGALPLSRADRHADETQRERRRLLARLRNLLLYSALRYEEAVVWIDADVIKIPGEAVEVMLKSGKDVVTARCTHGSADDYDLNAWAGPRVKPTPQELAKIRQGHLFVPRATSGTQFLSYHIDDNPHKFIELDSVGGTFLFVRADVHRQGAVFPTLYVVGTEWDTVDGWDGIETEGLCFLARTIGYRCWGMPNMQITHDDS